MKKKFKIKSGNPCKNVNFTLNVDGGVVCWAGEEKKSESWYGPIYHGGKCVCGSQLMFIHDDVVRCGWCVKPFHNK